MEPDERKQLVTDWIEHHTQQLAWDRHNVLQRQSLHPYVVDALDELSRTDLDECGGEHVDEPVDLGGLQVEHP